MWLLGYLFLLQLALCQSQYYLANQVVGCDGVIGSGKVVDRCGVCGGQSNSCRVVSGIFTKKTSKAAYEYITEIPIGASNINITEGRNTRNYLALRYAKDSQGIINGNWTLDWSGDYQAAGSIVKYRKSKHHQLQGETIFIKGPLQKAIQLLLLAQTRNPGIYYSYTLPAERKADGTSKSSSTKISALTSKTSQARKELPKYLENSLRNRNLAQRSAVKYEWKVINTGECTRECGEGYREIKVVCILVSSQASVTDENCIDKLKPETPQIKCNTQPCAPEWVTSEWSECSATCGQSTQLRQVTCRQRISATQTISVYASNCKNLIRPSTVQMCAEKVCYSWKQSEWSQCSAKCGAGERQRQVQCVNSDGMQVDDSNCLISKPRQTERCYSSCEESWFYGKWSTEECSKSCNVGNSTRQVFCPADAGSNYMAYSKCGAKPETVRPCEERVECTKRSQWLTGEWYQCTGTCNEAYQNREIFCMESVEGRKELANDSRCDIRSKPDSKQKCRPADCDVHTSEWLVTEWSQCSVTCGGGYSRRQIKCIDKNQIESYDCPPSDKPVITKLCTMPACTQPSVVVANPKCRDKYDTCKVVVQARLCKLSYYNRLCCESCAYQQHSASLVG